MKKKGWIGQLKRMVGLVKQTFISALIIQISDEKHWEGFVRYREKSQQPTFKPCGGWH